VQNSVRLAADEAIARLNPSATELAALRDAFVPHLVRLRLDDGRRVRQPAPLASLPREAERLIRALTEARLLTVRIDEGGGVAEVAHEALFAAWPTLSSWLDEEHAFLADIERIKSAHEVWSEAEAEHKQHGLLQGLLLSNARHWLVTHPQRFIGREMETLRGFVVASVTAADAARARSEQTRRQRFQIAIGAAIFFFAVSLFSGWQYFRAEGARRDATEQESVAKAQRDRAQDAQRVATEQERIAKDALAAAQLNESRFLTSIAETSLRNGNPERASLIARTALPVDVRQPNPNRLFWPPAVQVLAQARQADLMLAVLAGHTSFVYGAGWSPDGSRIVTASAGETARIWDAKSGVSLSILQGHRGEINSAAWCPDGSRIMTASADETARIWDTKTGTSIIVLKGHTDQVRSAAWSPDGSRIVTASWDKTARIWNSQTGALMVMLEGPAYPFNSAAWSPDGMRIVTASGDKTARIWNAQTGAPLVVLKGHAGAVVSAAWSPRWITHRDHIQRQDRDDLGC
jgi:hypothetical protein